MRGSHWAVCGGGCKSVYVVCVCVWLAGCSTMCVLILMIDSLDISRQDTLLTMLPLLYSSVVVEFLNDCSSQNIKPFHQDSKFCVSDQTKM